MTPLGSPGPGPRLPTAASRTFRSLNDVRVYSIVEGQGSVVHCAVERVLGLTWPPSWFDGGTGLALVRMKPNPLVRKA
jgi:hypothetical protein